MGHMGVFFLSQFFFTSGIFNDTDKIFKCKLIFFLLVSVCTYDIIMKIPHALEIVYLCNTKTLKMTSYFSPTNLFFFFFTFNMIFN